jgi:hypothetical protein
MENTVSKIKALFSGLSNFAIYGYTAFGLIVWVLNQFGIDALSILAHSTVQAEFYGVTGGLIGIAKTAQILIRTVLTKIETRTSATYTSLLLVVKSLLISMETLNTGELENSTQLTNITNVLKKIIEFDTILAEKNLSSVILTDDQILKLENFIQSASDFK